MFVSIVLIVLLVLIVTHIYLRNKNLPPGPYGIPIVGYSPFLGKNPIRTLTNLRQKYGNVICVSLGMTPVIVLNDIEATKEALVKQGDIFSGRPDLTTPKILYNGMDMIYSDGPIWKKQRAYSLHTMREFGLGRSTTETIIMEQVDTLIEILAARDGHSVQITQMLFVPLMNIIWKIAAGKQFEITDEYIQSFKKAIQFAIPGRWRIINHLPLLRFLVPGGLGYDLVKRNADQIHQYLVKEVDNHCRDFQENNLRDFIDSYLSEILKRKETGKDRPPFHRDHLVGSIMDFFVAGIETTNSTLSWGLLQMALKPEIQRKVQKELDQLMPKDSFLSLASRKLAPYTEATLLEIQRYATVAPLAVPHRTLKGTTLLGHKIPKNSTVFVNLYAIHRDERYWSDPEEFCPERFLEESGTTVKSNCSFAPFSLGPRQCLGESMAKMELFLFFTRLVTRFTFELDPNEPKPSLEPVVSGLLRPQPFNLVVKRRSLVCA